MMEDQSSPKKIVASGTMKCKAQLLLFLLLSASAVHAQEFVFPLNHDLNTRIGAALTADTTGFHSSCQPYSVIELEKVMDLSKQLDRPVGKSKCYSTGIGRKLFSEHLIDVDADELKLSIDPVFNLQVGQDRFARKNLFVNTRGVLVQGNYKSKFAFYSSFHENQARYVSYVDSFIRRYQVVPGQGRVKFMDQEVFDFSRSTGGIAYQLNRHFDFLLANDNLFIGEGYRSMLLSDNSHPIPFLRANMNFWKFRYSVIYTVMQDLQSTPDENTGYPKKYATFHYLDLNIGRKNRLTAGIFEAVVWKPAASRGYELHYLNPMLFLRPVENSLGSPDNALLGLNLRWKASPSSSVYGQVMLDEFLLDEVRGGRGWWGNKQAAQLGFKSYDVFHVKNLNVRTEFNLARPFTYTHRSNAQNYTNCNQALAHPLGTDFYEGLFFINYRHRNLFAELKLQYAQCGKDTAGQNLGNDLFLSYDTRPYEYGYYLTTGLKSTLQSVGLRLNYLVNPKTNFVIETGVEARRYSNAIDFRRSDVVYFGIRTSLQNYYFDF